MLRFDSIITDSSGVITSDVASLSRLLLRNHVVRMRNRTYVRVYVQHLCVTRV